MGRSSVVRQAELWAAAAGLGAGLASLAPAARCGGGPCTSCGACLGAAAVVSLFVVRRVVRRVGGGREAAESEGPAASKDSGSPR